MEAGRFSGVEQEKSGGSSNDDGERQKCKGYILDVQCLGLSESLDVGLEQDQGTEDDT